MYLINADENKKNKIGILILRVYRVNSNCTVLVIPILGHKVIKH